MREIFILALIILFFVFGCGGCVGSNIDVNLFSGNESSTVERLPDRGISEMTWK